LNEDWQRDRIATAGSGSGHQSRLHNPARIGINAHHSKTCVEHDQQGQDPREGYAKMSRICQVTGKAPVSGNNVSHAHNKTRRRFLPNLHRRRIWVESEQRWVKLRVSTKGLRIIDKLGIDVVLADLRAAGTKV